ncbi:SpaA isopeptide-forming pilin-related protein [Gemmiger formicilis]
MNHKFKLKQRVAALCMAAMMCCSLFPAGVFAEAPRADADGTLIMEQDKEAVTDDSHQTEASDPDPGEERTPKSSEAAATSQSADEDAPVETSTDYTFDGAVLYTDLPDAPTGSYMGSQGLPVATGETKIGISAWPNDQLEESADSYLSADTLNSDDMTMMVPLLESTDYAVAPILAQVEYPADSSSLDVVLPNEVTVLDFYGAPADETTRISLVHSEYAETSAAVMGLYVRADADFSAQLVYTAPDGNTLTKALHVVIDRSRTMAAPFAETTDIAAYAERPTPAVTSGKITKVEKVNGTWLIWFNGEEAYCCTHGANGQPKGCPPYTYTNTSLVSADQCIPGDHYGNQYRIWGGLDQLSMDLLPDTPAVFSAEDTERISLLDFCRTIYDDTQLWLIENYPESTAAKIYLESAQALLDGAVAYANPRGYYTYIYTPARSGWQTVALIGPEISEEETEEPKPVVQEYYASWEAPAQSTSGTVNLTYGITTDKIQLKTLEKVDGATIEIEPITKSGTIDGGSWSISPAGVQTVTTGGHTNDDNYQNNGGAASASWSVHYTVSKTVDGHSGTVGPYTTKEAADAAANSERDSAVAAIQAEAQSAVNNAIASAQAQLASLQFRYDEVTIPYGFESYWGSNGSHQTITVPANSNNAYEMRNAEWSLQINVKKTDSETGNQIAGNARYEVYQWDVVTGKYQPTGGYNTYSVQRQGDGTYAVINNAAYATNDTMRHTLYYTQRNEGRFIVVETKAPAGYFGDWTDVDHPGTAGTPLGKRAYYVEITADNNNSVLWLGNGDYNADIATGDKGGTKLVTSGGVETTVTIYDSPKDASRSYTTDASGKAANEDGYTTTAADGIMKNDRTLGEISISKVDLDAQRYVTGDAAHGNAVLDGAVYDLYAAEDITHPDGVTGVVDYSKIVDSNGNPLWHTTIRDNSGQWIGDYLPILKKDNLVASAKIEDGCLTFSNLYLGKYYVVERSTGTVIPLREGALTVSGTYPTVDSRTKAATGQVAALAASNGQYTDWVYKNQFSTISKSKALDGTWTYDAYYLSYAPGYLCDEHNYYITPSYADEGWYVEKTTFANDTAAYNGNYHIHKDNGLTESQDQVAKGNVEISKVVSSSGQSNGLELEGAGFTFYLVSDLSKVEQFDQTRTGSYTLQSILDAYINKEYDNEHPKWDFSGETQAIARTYEVNADEMAAYNKTLTAAGDNKNGKGDGWQPTGRANEYQLTEIFSNDSGNIRVQGLSYGTYLVVETTTPHDLFQAEPFLVSIDPEQDNNPWGAMATPKDSVMKASDSYQKFTVLDEEIEVYLKITKLDTETGKPVLLPNTAFQIYWLDENGNYRLENGKPKLVTMTDTVNGHLTKNVDTFYTNEEGILTLPEKLPLGKYRIVETVGPDGFYNEWADSGNYYVDFDISTDRIYKATGDDSENGMDTLVIGEDYWNEETLGKLTIRKTGNALTGKIETNDLIDPWMTGEADSDFAYMLRPLAGAEYTITAAEDIYTQDRQLDANGSRTLWYAKGDVVAVVTTGDGSADTAVFAPSRTKATYDFLSVIHDGTLGEVSITLPLGSYHVEETKPPYEYIGTTDSYDVTFVWDNQLNDVVMAKNIVKNGDDEQHFDVVRASETSAELAEQQTLGFYNDREHARVGVYKIDQETDKYLAGAVFNLYTRDDIYDVGGNKLFSAGDLISTSPETVADGYTYFNCDVPIRGEWYGQSDRLDASTNSGNYFIRELHAPLGYYLNDAEMDVTFTYDGEVLQVLDTTCANKPTEMWVSKRDLTNDEELPGATLTVKDAKDNIVDTWVSTDTPHRVTGLHFDEEYTLMEQRPADGYAVADDIVFRLERKADADGHELDEADVYYLKDKKKLWIIPWEKWELLDDATVIMRDDITRVQISKVDIATGKELSGAELVIKDKDGNTVAQWVSEDKPHYIEKLPSGDYTLTEITAPNGYQLAESIAFTVLPTGELQTVVMKDARIPEETPHEDSPSNTPQPTPDSTPAPTPAPASAPTATPTPMPVIPQTGDVFPFALLSAAVFGSIVGFGIFAYKRRKSKMDESEH